MAELAEVGVASAKRYNDLASHPSFSVILGADSLVSPRSGIGRVTFEVGQSLRSFIGLNFCLWVENSLTEFAVLDELGADRNPFPAPRPRPMRIFIGNLPGVRPLRSELLRRRMQASIRKFAELAGGRVLYHETNMILKPFDGIAVSHVHDLSWLHCREMHPDDRLRWIDRNIDHTLRDARRFVSVSRFTADSLVQAFGIPSDRIDVIPNAVSSSFRPRSAEEAGPTLAKYELVDRSYVLTVSTLEPRKNLDRLLAAHLALPALTRARFPLTIVGASGWGVTLASQAAARARQDGTLRILGRLSDEELVDIMARSACFAYVSLYEGFGIPVLEAMATGVPVVASSTTATGETAGEAALLVDPTSEEDITAAIEQVLDDQVLAAMLGIKGVKRAAEFNWGRTATELVNCWERALS